MECKNCNIQLTEADSFCPNCGQKNIPVLNMKFVLEEFFQTIYNVDSKLFRSLKFLIFKPGYLSNEYIAGKRVSYLPPIRIYLVLSFLFFFLISVFDFENDTGITPDITFNGSSGQENVLNNDSTIVEGVKFTLNGKNVTVPASTLRKLQFEGRLEEGLDSLTAEMPKFAGYVSKKLAMAELNDDGFIDVLRDQFSLFLLLFLPFFALLYSIIFSKNKRGFVGHLIFNLHLNSFLIFLLLIDFFIGSIIGNNETVSIIWSAFLIIAAQFYIIKAVMFFYNRKWWVAIYKYLLLLFGYGVLAVLFIIMVFFSSIVML